MPEADYEYKLDTSVTVADIIGDKQWVDRQTYIGKAMLVSSFDDADVFVIDKGEESLNPAHIIIRHDGIVDEIQHEWRTRFGNAFDVYQGDYDNDGEMEIVSICYVAGGTMCSVDELAVYKKIDGHYQRFAMAQDAMLDEYIEPVIDNENHTLAVNIKGSDVSYKMNTSEMYPDGVDGLTWGMVTNHTAEGNSLSTKACLFIESGKGFPDTDLYVTMKVNFENGEFTFSDPVFEYMGEIVTSEQTALTPEDVIAQLYEKDGAETVEYYKSKIAGSFEFDGNLCVIVDDNMMVSIVNSGTMESVDISKNAEYADIKIVEGNGTYYLVTKCVKGFDTAFRTWGEVIDISTAEAVADYYYEYDEASCTDSTPVDELPTSEEFDSYADLTVVENISQTLKDIFNN